MRNKVASLDIEIAEVAAVQHGVITHEQLVKAGLGRSAISRRASGGRLYRVHRGVYSVGHPPLSNEAWWMAAVLACGEQAALSHASAAALWGLLRPIDGPTDVSVPSNSGRARRAGIRIHRCGSLTAETKASLLRQEQQSRLGPARTRRDGIPVTAPWRTVEDLRRSVSTRLYRRARRQAELQGFLLAPRDRGERTRSDLEDDFLGFVRRRRLPSPEVNVKLGRWEVDFLWREARLVVEADFYETHRGSVAFEDDHQREMDLRGMGYAVRRYTGDQLRACPAEIAAELREVLAPAGERLRSRDRAP